MSGNPTPLAYDDPIERVEWGVAAAGDDDVVPLLDEATARQIVSERPGLVLLQRKVVYHPWTVTRGRPAPRA